MQNGFDIWVSPHLKLPPLHPKLTHLVPYTLFPTLLNLPPTGPILWITTTNPTNLAEENLKNLGILER